MGSTKKPFKKKYLMFGQIFGGRSGCKLFASPRKNRQVLIEYLKNKYTFPVHKGK